MVKLAIDIMGGDHAPLEIIKGVDIALARFDDLELILFGDADIIKRNLQATERVKIVHAPEKIDMGEKARSAPFGATARSRSSRPSRPSATAKRPER